MKDYYIATKLRIVQAHRRRQVLCQQWRRRQFDPSPPKSSTLRRLLHESCASQTIHPTYSDTDLVEFPSYGCLPVYSRVCWRAVASRDPLPGWGVSRRLATTPERDPTSTMFILYLFNSLGHVRLILIFIEQTFIVTLWLIISTFRTVSATTWPSLLSLTFCLMNFVWTRAIFVVCMSTSFDKFSTLSPVAVTRASNWTISFFCPVSSLLTTSRLCRNIMIDVYDWPSVY